MCGATSAQTQLQSAQAQFYSQMTQEQSTVFGEDQDILAAVTKATSPIIAAGPDQQGFGAAEMTNLQNQATEGVADNYQKISKAEGAEMAAEGGGNSFEPSGAKEELTQQIGTAAANQESNEQSQITEADYQQGNVNYTNAVGELEGAEGLNEATNYASDANTAGSAEGTTAAQIASENDSVWSGVEGMLGGVAGAAAGNPSNEIPGM